MEAREKVEVSALNLPDEIVSWIDNAPIYESSGQSGARTVFINRDEGFYLKIATKESLALAAQMQAYFAKKDMSSFVYKYLSTDKDYLITIQLKGEDGTTEKYLLQPEKLSQIFGQSLRILHEIDLSDCPIRDRMSRLLSSAQNTLFLQTHLNDIADYIGTAKADAAAYEIMANKKILKNDVLIHGDYCLPNIMLNNWIFTGFIDVGDGGIGDRHYDLVWGLWTLNWNLKNSKYGQLFLNAYGWDCIDKDRLRICGLLAAME